MLVNFCTINVKNWVKNPQNIYIGRQTALLESSKWETVAGKHYGKSRYVRPTKTVTVSGSMQGSSGEKYWSFLGRNTCAEIKDEGAG